MENPLSISADHIAHLFRGGSLTANLFAMANLYDTDNQSRIRDRIDNPIRSLAYAVLVIVAGKFFTTGGSRIGGKILNSLDDPETIFLWS